MFADMLLSVMSFFLISSTTVTSGRYHKSCSSYEYKISYKRGGIPVDTEPCLFWTRWWKFTLWNVDVGGPNLFVHWKLSDICWSKVKTDRFFFLHKTSTQKYKGLLIHTFVFGFDTLHSQRKRMKIIRLWPNLLNMSKTGFREFLRWKVLFYSRLGLMQGFWQKFFLAKMLNLILTGG